MKNKNNILCAIGAICSVVLYVITFVSCTAGMKGFVQIFKKLDSFLLKNKERQQKIKELKENGEIFSESFTINRRLVNDRGDSIDENGILHSANAK